ncbi:MAG: flagellar type III secretion system protein FlhB [Pseudomonadota bacterium]
MEEGGSDEGEKTQEPTEQKILDARKKGDVAKSTDLAVFAAYLGLLIAMAAAGQAAVEQAGAVMSRIFTDADTLSARLLATGGRGLSLQIVGEALLGFSAIFGIPFLLVLLVFAIQRVIIFVPDKVIPKMNRISPIEQAKQKFGITGLFEFAKSAVKMLIFSILLGAFLYMQKDAVVGAVRAIPKAVPATMMEMANALLIQIALIALLIGAVDYLWQLYDHRRKLRMSVQEIKDEVKRSEGDPAMKSKRRQRAEEIATNRMMTKVPEATVVVVNPTHYAVALKWNRALDPAPIVVAKGVDETALTIRRVATEADVPIYSDPVTARALEATVPIGKEIDPTHYQAVAAAIRFAEAMRAKARERGE